jgi:2-polyprenyl-3-methyl-5-hydroxy-6-metoxy-1,4-benzoquinol methylase
VLEIGCNKGYCLRVLQELGYQHLYGVDLAERELEQARSMVPRAQFACEDAQTYLTRNSQSFDVILMKAVLEHVRKEEVIPLLRALADGLRPGGVALIDVPNMDWLFAPHERFMDFTHEVGFTQESLRQVVQVAFNNVDVYPLETAIPGPRGKAKRLIGRAVLHTLLRWADAEGGSGPIWQRGLLAVAHK